MRSYARLQGTQATAAVIKEPSFKMVLTATGEYAYHGDGCRAGGDDVDVWLRENPDGQDDEELYGPHIE